MSGSAKSTTWASISQMFVLIIAFLLHHSLPFLQLPYLIDGDKKITQTHVITRYLGMKHGLGRCQVLTLTLLF